MWTGILSDGLIRSFFIKGDLNDQKYENLLKNEVVSAITIVGENIQNTWF